MSENNRWLLPEGIEEVLPEQAARVETLRRKLLDVYATWGYQQVMPPQIEFLESLLTGTGHDLELQTFKLTDQMSGRMMGVRADMTPQVARIDAHHLRREEPTRLCYMGTALRTQPEGIARTRSPLQIGVELYGHAGIESDLEVLELMIETLQLAGCRDFHIDLGHVAIYRTLVADEELDTEQEQSLFDIMQRKAKAELQDFLSQHKLANATMLLALIGLHGDAAILDQAAVELQQAPVGVQEAIGQLQRVVAHLQVRHPELPLHFDLAELRGYHYHTGAVFAAYVPGHGQAVAMGGRYDHIGEVFGRARPATGFSTDMRTLNLVATPQTIMRDCIWAPAADDASLGDKIRELRAAGECVISELAGESGDASAHGCQRKLTNQDGDWQVVSL